MLNTLVISFLASLLIPTLASAQSSEMASGNRTNNSKASTAQSGSISVAGNYCAAGSDYFERELHRLNTDKNDKSFHAFLMQMIPSTKPVINPKCIESALDQVSAESSKFVYCNTNNQPIVATHEPCSSPHDTKMIHQSFEVVTSCLKDFVSGHKDEKIQNDWVESYFKILTKESGMHTNIVSPTGAVGTAQLTSSYKADFVEWNLENVRQHLEKSPNTYCRSLGKEYLSDDALADSMKTCSRVQIDKGQPVQGLIIGFSHLKVYRQRISRTLYAKPEILNLSDSEKARLEIILTSLSYNMGTGGLNYPLNKALNEYNEASPVTNANQLIQKVLEHIPSMKKFTKTVTIKGARKKVRLYGNIRLEEMMHYLQRTQKRYSDVRNSAQVGSCRLR